MIRAELAQLVTEWLVSTSWGAPSLRHTSPASFCAASFDQSRLTLRKVRRSERARGLKVSQSLQRCLRCSSDCQQLARAPVLLKLSGWYPG